MTLRGLAIVLSPVILAIQMPIAFAEEPPEALLEIDHATGKASFFPLGKKCSEGREVASGKRVRLRTSRRLIISVHNSNRALYAYDLKLRDVESDEIATLKAAAKGFGPTIPDFLTTVVRDTKSVSVLPFDRLAKDLEKVRGLLAKSEAAETLVRLSIRDMEALEADYSSSTTPEDISTRLTELQKIVKTLQYTIVDEHGFFVRTDGSFLLVLRKEVRDAMAALAESYAHLNEAAETKDADTIEAAREVLDSKKEIAEALSNLQTLGANALTADQPYEFPPISVTLETGKSLLVTVTRRESSDESADLARNHLEFSLTVLPDWVIRPALGLSLLYSPESSFPTFEARETSQGDQFFESGEQDRQFTYGLVLGVTYRAIDWRDRKSQLAVWPIELTVNPSDDVKAFGLGTAVSWNMVKLGVGGLWTKHAVTVGTPPVKTRDTYGDSKLYISLSIFGWPPFVPE